MIEGDAQAALNAFLIAFPRRPDIDEHWCPVVCLPVHAVSRDLRAQSLGRDGQIGSRRDALQPVLEVAEDVIEPDSTRRVADSGSRPGSAMITIG